MTSNRGKSRRVAHKAIAEYVTDGLTIFNFDVFCDLLLNSCMVTWNLLVLYNKETGKNVTDVIYTSVFQLIMSKRQSKCEDNLTDCIKSHGLLY